MTNVNTHKTSYIPAHTESSSAYPITPHQAQLLEQWGTETQYESPIAPVFVPKENAHEHTTPIERSIALIIRLIPFTIIWFVLSLAVVWIFSITNAIGLLLFALLTALTYYVMDRSERDFSTNGLERHRIDVAASLAREKQRTNDHLRREVVRAHLHLLEKQREDHRI